MTDITQFKRTLQDWVLQQEDISAVALVGSWARARATDTSDVDTMILVDNPQIYLDDDSWITQFGEVEEIRREDWGLVQTKRVFYKNGLEAEFNFTTAAWANTNPVDPGTQRVVSDGMQIIIDKDQLLHHLRDGINGFNRKKMD